MTEQSAFANSEHGGHGFALTGDGGMSDRVYVVMQPVQPGGPGRSQNGVGRIADISQLPAGDDAVLTPGKLR